MSTAMLETGDTYKDEVQRQWDRDPCGAQYVKEAHPDTLEWFLEVERYRYDVYAPWMREVMEFDRHAGEHILEIGAGIGTDHAQFAKAGGIMYDVDLASGHLDLAKRNFELRGLQGTFRHGDAETIPFNDNSFDLVYSNGVIHHTPNTTQVVKEIYRVLKPGGAASSWYTRKIRCTIGGSFSGRSDCSSTSSTQALWARLCRATLKFPITARNPWLRCTRPSV